MPSLTFNYTRQQLELGQVEPIGVKVAPEERSLLLGQQNAEGTLPGELRFEAMGAAPVQCRASIPRVAFMKLFGTGVLAAATGMAHSSDPGVASSCALAFAVNAVACAHYVLIWRIRAQAFGLKPYNNLMVGFGRGSDYKDEVAKNANKLYAQELATDGLRYALTQRPISPR